MLSITSEVEADDFLRANALAMLKFSATWCGPCKAVAPAISRLATQFSQVSMADVDIDNNQDTAQKHQVTAVPTFVFFEKGVEVDRIKGGDVAGVTAALKKLSAKAMKVSSGNFGKGHKLGADISTTSSVSSSLDQARDTELQNIRARRLEAIERAAKESAQESAQESNDTDPVAKVSEKKPLSRTTRNSTRSSTRKTASAGSPWPAFSLASLKPLTNWLMLYIVTLFSLDAKSAATIYAREHPI